MVYTRLYVLVLAFYNWAKDEYGIVPCNAFLDDLYRIIAKMMYEVNVGTLDRVDAIKRINDMGKVACYAPMPWIGSDSDAAFHNMVRPFVNQALNDLGTRSHHAWQLTTSKEWFELFKENHLLDDDKACGLGS